MDKTSLKVATDIKKNRLYITIAGSLTKRDIDRCYTDLKLGVSDLSDGFSVVSDLSECSFVSLDGIPTLKRIMQHLITNGAGSVVRVFNKQKTIYTQAKNFTDRTQGYCAVNVDSLEKAEEVLSQLEYRGGLRFYLHNQPVEYILQKTTGQGLIKDISTSGCAVEQATIIPAVDDKMHFSTSFDSNADMLQRFKGVGQVTWVEDDSFAVKFIHTDNQQKEALWERLVHESTSEIDPQ